MRTKIGNKILELVYDDITEQDTEAIVNAANRTLVGGGGVDGAIHRAAGHAPMEEIKNAFPNGIEPGTAISTNGGRLISRLIIHTVGPIWHGGTENEATILYNAYDGSLRLANTLGCWSVAFPSISTGAFHYPIHLAARIAMTATMDWMLENPKSKTRVIRFVLFDENTFEWYNDTLEKAVNEHNVSALI